MGALLLTSCAKGILPDKEPYYQCMVLHGSKLNCYPMVTLSEAEYEMDFKDPSLVGGFYFSSEDFQKRENYIIKLEEKIKGHGPH